MTTIEERIASRLAELREEARIAEARLDRLNAKIEELETLASDETLETLAGDEEHEEATPERNGAAKKLRPKPSTNGHPRGRAAQVPPAQRQRAAAQALRSGPMGFETLKKQLHWSASTLSGVLKGSPWFDQPTSRGPWELTEEGRSAAL